MCRFMSWDIFHHHALEHFEYYWRLDSDSFLHSKLHRDPIETLALSGATYGFVLDSTDPSYAVFGLWNTTKAFLVDFFGETRGRAMADRFLAAEGRDYGNKDGGSVFYTNFEISKLQFWRTEPYVSFFRAVERAGGVYQHRWGDAALHYLAVRLFVDPSKVIRFADVPYWHQYSVYAPSKGRIIQMATLDPDS